MLFAGITSLANPKVLGLVALVAVTGGLSHCATKLYYKGEVAETKLENKKIELALQTEKLRRKDFEDKLNVEVSNELQTKLAAVDARSAAALQRIGSVRLCRPTSVSSAVPVSVPAGGPDDSPKLEQSRDVGKDLKDLVAQCDRQAERLAVLQDFVRKVVDDSK